MFYLAHTIAFPSRMVVEQEQTAYKRRIESRPLGLGSSNPATLPGSAVLSLTGSFSSRVCRGGRLRVGDTTSGQISALGSVARPLSLYSYFFGGKACSMMSEYVSPTALSALRRFASSSDISIFTFLGFLSILSVMNISTQV